MDEWANTARQTKQLSYTRFRTRMTRRFLQFLNKYIYITFRKRHIRRNARRLICVPSLHSLDLLLEAVSFGLFSFQSLPLSSTFPFLFFWQSINWKNTVGLPVRCGSERPQARIAMCAFGAYSGEESMLSLSMRIGTDASVLSFPSNYSSLLSLGMSNFLLQAKMTPATCSLQAVSHWFMLHFLLLHI